MQDPRASSSRPDRGLLRRVCLAFSAATFLLWNGAARAESVAILWPPNPSADVTQAMTLLNGELLSVGLWVVNADRTAVHSEASDSASWLARFAPRGISAVVAPVGDGVLEAVDVGIFKPHPDRFEITRVAVEAAAPKQPEVLALHALEALRAGLLQLDWAARKRRDQPPPKPAAAIVPESPAPARTTPSARLALEAGATGLMSLDGTGPAILPTVRIGWAARSWLELDARAAGLGSRATVSASGAGARVGQSFAAVGGRYRLRPERRLWPFLGLALGVLRTSVEGQSRLGTGEHTGARWSGMGEVSVGTGLRLYGSAYVSLAAHAQIAVPYVAIYLVDGVRATSGRPNLLVSLTIGASL